MIVLPKALGRTLLAAMLALSAGCSSDGEVPHDPDPGAFESANPSGSGAGRDVTIGPDSSTGGSGGTTTGGAGGAAPGAPGDEAAREIEEADIVQIEGGKLYALSRYGGLSVIDVAERDRMSVLGRHKIVATPFEMYVRDGIVIALYNGYAEYGYDGDEELWYYYQQGYVIALDASDPSNIVELERFAVPGEISDSRIVGNALYVAAFENGYCWNCETAPRTRVLSLDVANPATIRQVDELVFADSEGSYSWRRSLAATNQRLYVAGPVYGPTEPVGSTIQVVDISDPGGRMLPGAAVEVAGQVESRWQMDEHEGVLRVISQPFAWRIDRAPAIETFRIVSSSELTPLGTSTLTLPRPERLQSVRFDGARAYAITFEQTDPLFTIDLTNPAAPRQVGELEMPGWVYHMEPRGDRVLGLGFDQGNEAGAITVSLFDVSDLANPTMIDRVNFGGDWGSLSEDQDRIHKAFKVLDAEGLILVPFSGYSYTNGSASECYSGAYVSGVQLVDWANDALSLRGVAPSVGEARRGLLHDGRLLTVSDERVESFDITNRDRPQRTAGLALARQVTHAAGVGDGVVRVSQDWWTNTTQIDVTPLSSVEDPTATTVLELPQLDSRACYQSTWLGDVHSSGSNGYLVYQSYEYGPGYSTSTQRTRVITLDLADAAAPSVAGDVEIAATPDSYGYGYYGYGYGYGYGLLASGSASVAHGSTLVLSQRGGGGYQGEPVRADSGLAIVDLADPSAPRVIQVPLSPTLGFTGLLLSGSIVATSHYEASPVNKGMVRFYLDRVNVSDPARPVALPRVSIPGSLVAFDAVSSHAITSDYTAVTLAGVTSDDCYRNYGGYDFRTPAGVQYDSPAARGSCVALQQSLRLVQVVDNRAAIVDSHELALGEHVTTTALGDDRLFVSVGRSGHGYGYGGIGVSVDGAGYVSSFESDDATVLVMSGIRSGSFETARLEVPSGNSWSYVPLVASGTSAVISTGWNGKLSVVDASNPRSPRVAREVDVGGYVQDLDIVGRTAVASLGYDGVATISLEP